MSAEILTKESEVMTLKVNKHDYLERLQAVIEELYGCEVTHRRTATVQVANGKTIWKGKVEVFRLSGHREARRCFAWSCMEDGGGENKEDLAVILEDATVAGPVTAVKAAIAMKARCQSLNASSLPTLCEEHFVRRPHEKARSKRSFDVTKDWHSRAS